MKKVVTIVAVMFVYFMFVSQVVAEQKEHGTHWGTQDKRGQSIGERLRLSMLCAQMDWHSHP